MKLKEINEASFLGNYGSAALQQLGNRITGRGEGELSIQDKMTKNMFIQNLIGRAYASLNAAIQSGRVDVNATSAPATASPAAAPSTAPAAPAAAPATGATNKTVPGNAAAPGAAQRQTSQNINNYVRSISASLNKEPDKAKKMALAKELVNFMADRKNYPEWQNALATAQQVIQKGIQDPNFTNSAINRLKAGQMMEAWQAYWINKLLESIGFTWKDLGLVLLKENKTNGKYIITESKYYHLNNIFESILLEAESVGSFMNKWLFQYLKSKGMDPNNSNVKQIFALVPEIEKNYKVDKGRAALNKIANDAYALVYSHQGQDTTTGTDTGAAPASGEPAAPGAAAAPAKTGTSTDTIINSLQSLLAKLKGIDPATHAEIVKKIGAGQSLQLPSPNSVKESKHQK